MRLPNGCSIYHVRANNKNVFDYETIWVFGVPGKEWMTIIQLSVEMDIYNLFITMYWQLNCTFDDGV